MDKSFDFGDRSALLTSKRSDKDSGLASEQDESNVIVNYPVLTDKTVSVNIWNR